MKDLEQTTQQQSKVAEDTKEIRDRYKEQMRERLKQRAQAMKDQLLRETDALLENYRRIQPTELDNNAERPLEEVQAQLENVKNALKVDDFDLAAESAQQAEVAGEELRSSGDRQRRMDELFERPPQMRQRSQQVAEQLAEDADRTRDISRRLQQLFPPPGQMLSEEDRQQLRQLDQQQRQLEQQAQGLRNQMEEIQDLAPVFGEESMQQMQQVGEQMRDAAQQLAQRDPNRGYSQQREALEQLRQFQDQLRQQQQQQQQGGRGGMPLPLSMRPGGRGNNGQQTSREKVEIPDEDQFQAPKEFRKDLLEAMKQGAPDRYKEQVKRYYEELVK
jgi:DNA repair exonuclease SbcCD ATPase subunit